MNFMPVLKIQDSSHWTDISEPVRICDRADESLNRRHRHMLMSLCSLYWFTFQQCRTTYTSCQSLSFNMQWVTWCATSRVWKWILLGGWEIARCSDTVFGNIIDWWSFVVVVVSAKKHFENMLKSVKSFRFQKWLVLVSRKCDQVKAGLQTVTKLVRNVAKNKIVS